MRHEIPQNPSVNEPLGIIDGEKWKGVFDRLEGKEKALQALRLVTSLHGKQRRSDGIYIDHLLRVVDRLVNDFSIDDEDVIVAALLHDSVEDKASELALNSAHSESDDIRTQALKFIEKEFGERVATTVEKITIDERIEKLETEERNKEYLQYVKRAIKDPDVFYIKLADFMDNALRIESVERPQRRQALAAKYLPLYDIFMDRVSEENILFSKEKKELIVNKIHHAKEGAEHVLAAKD